MRHPIFSLRLTAVMLACVLLLSLAAPARAEADVMLIVALASVAVIVVIVVVYLVVASSRGPKMGSVSAPTESVPTMMACLEGEAGLRTCWPLAEATGPLALPEYAPQS